jgi:hypothetical protein
MAAWGDGGEVNLQYMDDITGIATNISAYDGMYLQIDTSQSSGKKFKFSSVSAGSTIWEADGVGINTLGSVGIGTTANSSYKLIVGSGNTADTVAYFDGNISVAGSTFSREVVELESLGIITATKGVDVISGGVDVTAGGINVAAGVATFSGIGTFGSNVFIDGNLSCVGVATFGSSSITIDGTTNKVNVGTAITMDATTGTIEVYSETSGKVSKLADPSGDADFVGIVTASKFVVGVGGTNLLSEIGTKTSIGLVLALS